MGSTAYQGLNNVGFYFNIFLLLSNYDRLSALKKVYDCDRLLKIICRVIMVMKHNE